MGKGEETRMSRSLLGEGSVRAGATRRHQGWASPRRCSPVGRTWICIVIAGGGLLFASAQEEPPSEQSHEREELGVNRYTAPSIDQVFKQLDKLKPLPFDRVWRDFPQSSPGPREQKALIFGGLVADGFLVVEAEKRNLIDDLGRVLIREARGLGVADRVMRHSASLTELGRTGKWAAIRNELIATQADVEQAMVDLRDEKMAHLISLGGWLRGLEISAEAVELNFSPTRAKILAQPELTDYFQEELATLPPGIAHNALFQKIRDGVKAIRAVLNKPAGAPLRAADIHTVYSHARELNLAMRKTE